MALFGRRKPKKVPVHPAETAEGKAAETTAGNREGEMEEKMKKNPGGNHSI